MITKEAYLKLVSELQSHHTDLVAVSKTHPPELVDELYQFGQRNFGENRALELRDKKPLLPADIRWHYIGHLQTNKIKYITPFVHLLHSVDSGHLLVEINREAKKLNRVIDCLLQMYIATEETKYGFSGDEVKQFLNSDAFHQLEHIRIRGVMGMATYTDDQQLVAKEFRSLRHSFEELKSGYVAAPSNFTIVSMGMTDDYRIAIEEGSTMVRIGSLLFGRR
jgi:PLP dependent protein